MCEFMYLHLGINFFLYEKASLGGKFQTCSEKMGHSLTLMPYLHTKKVYKLAALSYLWVYLVLCALNWVFTHPCYFNHKRSPALLHSDYNRSPDISQG